MNKVFWSGWILALVISSGAAQTDRDAGADRTEALGEVDFPVSCSASAQTEFNRGMALYHSFWFDPAKESFAQVRELDPDCTMALWGSAISTLGNPFGWPPTPKAMEAAGSAIAQASQAGAPTQREQAYIAALQEFFRGQDIEHRQRALAFESALGRLAERYPDDVEARIFHALLLNATADASDKKYTRQLQAAEILEPLFEQYPQHPGITHYLIHSYDYAELAERGLPAAETFARIAPSVPHALHMPTHIYSRVGYWPQMVEGNRASYEAARSELTRETLSATTYDALHAMDYMVFGHLQQAQDQAARRYLDELTAVRKVNVENFVAAYAFAAIPARFALERGQWQEAANLTLPASLDWDKFPQAEAILVYARGLGAAHVGDVGAAREDLARLQELQQEMRRAKADYWAKHADAQIAALEGWTAYADGRNGLALKRLRVAADEEDASDKHPVTPGHVLPSRVLLGELYMELERPHEALVQFQRSLEREPNRFRAVYGAARAAEAAGQDDIAQAYYHNLQELCVDRDTERPELRHAAAALQ
ncbi:hypothetical protein ACXYTJ_09875 [Gilvimarinus sp. F26214L]|uniref:hypothetical protein n=1 Tax=Gilvimarinus sp. DZF01 TaxID=3461371 RepID=UPI0040451F9F